MIELSALPRMPGLLHRPFHRRDFLKATLVSSVATVIHRSLEIRGDEASSELRLALVSDTHIGPGERAKDKRGYDPCAQLRRAIPDIVATKPRAMILNGDAASREGLVEDYQELKTLLQPLEQIAPVFVGLGNHDDRENFRRVFTDGPSLTSEVLKRQVLILDEPLMRFIVLDSLLYVNKAAGLLGEAQRTWLTEYLETHVDKPIILFVHHTLGESDGDLLDAARLFDIIRPHRQVKAIFYGHSHVWEIGEREGVKLINLPALGYNFVETDPVGWVDARFRRDGVDLTLRALAGNRANDGKTFPVRWG